MQRHPEKDPVESPRREIRPARGTARTIVACLALVAMGSIAMGIGCSTSRPKVRSEDDRLLAMAAKLQAPYPVRVVVTPISVDRRETTDSESASDYRPFIEDSRLSDWMEEFLSDPGISPFAEVCRSDIAPSTLLGKTDLPTLRLHLQINELDVRFEGRNDLWIPKVALWSLGILPSIGVAAEDYGVHVDLDVLLTDPLSPERIVYRAPLRLLVHTRLSDSARGWRPLGIFEAPENLKPWNWERIGDHLGPIVLRELEIELLTQFDEGLSAALDRWLEHRTMPAGLRTG